VVDLQTRVGGEEARTGIGEADEAAEGPSLLDETHSGADPDETGTGDPDGTRAGSVDKAIRRRWATAPRVATPIVDDPVLDFPEETKRQARGHRLLDLAGGDLGAPEDDGQTLTTPREALEPPRLDTDRMPTFSDEELATASAVEVTQRATPRALDSGRLPPLAEELLFGDDDSAMRLLHDVIDGPFPRPQLTVEPPPFPLLSDLPRGAFMELLARLSVVRLGAGEAVLREGDAGDACYLLAAGRVRVTKAGVTVAELGPGSFFGEFAVLSDQRRHASVETVDAVELLEIRRELLDELVAAHPGVARTLRTFYRERLLQTLVSTSPFFQRLSPDERAAVAERFRPRRFGRGAQIIEEGAPGGGLYLILVGEVEVVRADKEGQTVRLGTLGEGSYFGEMSLLRGGVASATVRALRMTEAVQLPPRDFYEMASQHPVLWEQLRSEAERRELANHAILAGEARKSDTFYLV
jgi:CRP-like cAMP-binding protein